MAEEFQFVDPAVKCPDQSTISENAVIIEAQNGKGKTVRIIDNTATVAENELRTLLDELIEQGHFGLKAVSVTGGNRVSFNEPISTHIQLGDDLYRLLIFPYEARIEPF